MVSILRCQSHKKYQGKAKPRSCCEQCWRIFITIKDNYCSYCNHDGKWCSEGRCHLLQDYGKVILRDPITKL